MHNLLRIIDANLNRSREGLRVCEDIARFILNDKKITGAFKSLRHKIGALAKNMDNLALFEKREKRLCLLRSRNVKKDIGKKTCFLEGKRKGLRHIFYANMQRAKESLRVLEEITKLLNRETANGFKRIRFKIYELEKKSSVKLEAIPRSKASAET